MRIKVDGMSCEHCKASVNKALQSIQGVQNVEVNLEGGYADVEAPESLRAALIQAIEEIGFDAA